MKSFRHFFFILTTLFVFSACSTDNQSTNKIPDLTIRWKLEKNYELNKRPVHDATFTITNNSAEDLNDNWEIYWNQSPRGLISIDSSAQVEMKRINGDFYTMKPKPGFKLEAGKSIAIKNISNVWMIKEADGPVGVYAVFNPGDNQTIKIIKDFKIEPFTKADQINRSIGDKEPIPTAEYLFEENRNLREVAPEELYKAIPSPRAYKKTTGAFDLKEAFAIGVQGDLKTEAGLLVDDLDRLFNLKTVVKDSEERINLRIDEKIADDEAYQILVEGDKIEISGTDKAGVFYGIQTLLNLIQEDKTIYACKISDNPAYPYRGMHIDVSRNFQSKETMIKMIDVLASYKVNKLVFCFTEDEAWRIEIDGLPELTQIGSKRGHPSKDGSNLQPSYGSGPFTSSATGSGYYTRADFKEIIKHAHDRHVDVVPLVNFPGHARAAIKSMEYRYNRLMKEGKEKEALEYRLIDPDDKSVYSTAQQYNDNVACVCQPSAFNFYKHVVEDIIKMYEEADVPLAMFHTGGDEVPQGPWTESPICDEYLKDFPEITNSRNLQAHFFAQIIDLMLEKNILIAGWEEVVMAYDDEGKWYPNPDFVGKGVHPNIWNNLWGLQDLGYKIANKGYPIILCNVTNFYFDLSYDKDPREPGLYWGGFNNTEDAFSFIPDDLFLSTTHDNMGNSLDPAKDFKGMERLTPQGQKNIHGLQAQLWSETVRGQDMFEYYILPKLMGFAQRSWEGQPVWGTETNTEKRTKAIADDWNRFANTLSQRDFPKLEKMNGGFNYRIPAPGVKVENGKLMMNSAYPGMQIRYTTDGSDPDMNSKIYEGPVDFSNGKVNAKVFNGSGRSGFTTYFSTEKDDLLN